MRVQRRAVAVVSKQGGVNAHHFSSFLSLDSNWSHFAPLFPVAFLVRLRSLVPRLEAIACFAPPRLEVTVVPITILFSLARRQEGLHFEHHHGTIDKQIHVRASH